MKCKEQQKKKPTTTTTTIAQSSGTPFISVALSELRSEGEIISDDLLAHVAPLGWEHITFNGDYVWPTEPLQNDFRPLRDPRSAFLDAA